jgi:hypothetical protein
VCAYLCSSNLALDDVGTSLDHSQLRNVLLNLLLKVLATHFQRGLKLPVLRRCLGAGLAQDLGEALRPLVRLPGRLEVIIKDMAPEIGSKRDSVPFYVCTLTCGKVPAWRQA